MAEAVSGRNSLKTLLFFTCRLIPVIFLFLTFSLHASPYDMILAGEPVIEDIRFLSLETGIPVLSFTPPFSPHEIRNFLSKIDENNLSPSGEEAYNRLQRRLNPETPISLTLENFSISLNIESTIEARARLNKDVDYPSNPKIPPFLSLVTKIFLFDTIQFYFDPALSIDPHDYSFNGHTSNGYLASNVLFLNDNHINANTPLRTFLAFGGTYWNFQLGRDRISYGTGITGNLGLADNPPFYEFMRLSLFTKQFKYSLLAIQSPLNVNSHNVLIDIDVYPNIDALFDNGLMSMSSQRNYYLHRIDFTLFNRLSIGIMEGVMVGNSGLELRYLNPLMIIHNAMTWLDYGYWSDDPSLPLSFLIGSFFSFEINWNIYKSFSLYTQFVMNEIALGPEMNNRNAESPNGLGFLVGSQYSFSVNNWSTLAFLESFYTFPFLYLNPSPYASLIYMDSIGLVHENNYFYWFGYPRDTLSVTLGTNSRNLNNNFGFDTSLSWIASGQKNQNGVIWDFRRTSKNYNLVSPSGIVEHKYILSLGARWDVYIWLTLQARMQGMYVVNNKHIKGNNEMNGLLSLSATFRY